jgi:VIT1/CCC1 family predicted Fe2+/Mn2+ transporter
MKEKIQKFLPSLVYGGSDGAVSYFTLMAGAYGAGLPIKMLLAIGVSNIFADAFSMASADFLSEDSKENSSKKESLKNAMVTFFAFVFVGLFPLYPSLMAYMNAGENATLPLSSFLFSTVLTLAAFILIGFIRGKVLKRNIIKTIFESVIICSLSASVAYFLGEYVAGLLG